MTRDITVSSPSPYLSLDFLFNDIYKMKIEEAPVSAVDEVEDEISDPDEDSLACQMAAMRGGNVKKRKEDSDDEDSLDEESDDDDSSSSDSD